MKVKSVRFKILSTTISFIVGMALIAASVGIIFLRNETTAKAETTMNLEVRARGEELNQSFLQIEDATIAIQYMAANGITSLDQLKNDVSFRTSYITSIQNSFDSVTARGRNAGGRTPGAAAYYLVLNPEISGLTQNDDHGDGFFFVRGIENPAYVSMPVSNILQYDPADDGHMAWWTYATDATLNPHHAAVWVKPYNNLDFNREIISFVAPIWFYDENEKTNNLIGVVGMDVNWSYIRNVVDGISIYKTGYAYLEDADNNIAYHKTLRPSLLAKVPEDVEITYTENSRFINFRSTNGKLISYKYNGVDKRAAFTTLRNGLKLYLTADRVDIYSTLRTSVIITTFSTIAIAVIFSFICFLIVEKIMKPIGEINKAAKEIASGNLEVAIDYKSCDEIGELASSFNYMSEKLDRNMRKIEEIAYHDSLTNVKNKTAYFKEVETLKEEIAHGDAEFALVMVDINELKYTNDHFGHEAGDENISLTARAIGRIFVHSKIYRVGGDEFVIIAQGDDLSSLEDRLQSMKAIAKRRDPKANTPTTVSVSYGYAICHKGDSREYADIFREADSNMYNQKKHGKKLLRATN